MTEVKNSVEKFKYQMWAGRRINELEGHTIKIIKSEEKKWKKNEEKQTQPKRPEENHKNDQYPCSGNCKRRKGQSKYL